MLQHAPRQHSQQATLRVKGGSAVNSLTVRCDLHLSLVQPNGACRREAVWCSSHSARLWLASRVWQHRQAPHAATAAADPTSSRRGYCWRQQRRRRQQAV